MKLLLVSIHIKDSPQAMPLPCAMLKAILDDKANPKINTSILDFYINNDCADVADRLLSQSPDLIGFSTYLWNRNLVIKIAKIIKSKAPSIILFAGGAESTALPCKLLNNAPFDFVISGEGEKTILSVMEKISDDKPPTNIPGVFHKDNFDQREYIPEIFTDLNELPSPFLEGTIDLEKYDGVLWELSRGCFFQCDFCFESRGIKGVRRFSIERIEKELKLFEEKKVSQIFVLDPTFNNDKKRVVKILELIKENAPQIHFTFEVRAEFLDNETVKLFGEINCGLQIGLQSSHPEILTNLNRKFDPENFIGKIGLLNSNGILFGFDLIYGLPGDNIDGFKDSINFAVGLQPNNLDIFPLAVIPGTKLYEKAGDLKLKYLEDTPYTIISTPSFNEDDLKKATILSNACDLFYNKGGAVGWLFIVLKTLDIKPSYFFDEFSKTLPADKNNNDYTRKEITLLQINFTKSTFQKYNKDNLYIVMENIIRYNEALQLSLYAGHETKTEVHYEYTDQTVFHLCSGTFFATLDYDVDALMELGEYNLEEFMEFFPPEKTFLVVYNYQGEVKYTMLDESWFRFLKSINGSKTFGEVLDENFMKESDQVKEFLGFAVEEYLICYTYDI